MATDPTGRFMSSGHEMLKHFLLDVNYKKLNHGTYALWFISWTFHLKKVFFSIISFSSLLFSFSSTASFQFLLCHPLIIVPFIRLAIPPGSTKVYVRSEFLPQGLSEQTSPSVVPN